MTFVKGYTPWNKGRRQALGWCFRHAERRVRPWPSGRSVCRTCHRVAQRSWNARNTDKLKAYRARSRARKATTCAT